MANTAEYFVTEDPKGFGNVLCLKQAWHPKLINVIRKNDIKVIRLSEFLGWKEDNISFLKSLPRIAGVEIVSRCVTDIQPLLELRHLKSLSLWCHAKGRLDFSTFKKLTSLFLVWRKAYHSALTLSTVERMNIVDYPGENLQLLKSNKVVRELSISSKKLTSLSGMKFFPHIEKLSLYGCRNLISLAGISTATSLTSLEFAKCGGMKDLSPLSKFENLISLAMEDCGEVDSVKPLMACSKLEYLQIAGKTNIVDGDLEVIKLLPRLKKILLANRRHYSHTGEQLREMINAPRSRFRMD